MMVAFGIPLVLSTFLVGPLELVGVEPTTQPVPCTNPSTSTDDIHKIFTKESVVEKLKRTQAEDQIIDLLDSTITMLPRAEAIEALVNAYDWAQNHTQTNIRAYVVLALEAIAPDHPRVRSFIDYA